MILGQTDFDELLLVKNEFAGSVENILDEAIGAKTCQGCMGQDSGAEHREKIVSQIIQQDQHFLSRPEALAMMGQEETLLIVSNIDLGGPCRS